MVIKLRLDFIEELSTKLMSSVYENGIPLLLVCSGWQNNVKAFV